MLDKMEAKHGKPHAEKRGRFYFFQRGGKTPGVTVSKSESLPDGDFKLTEYVFQNHGYVELWFVDQDRFTASERWAAYRAFFG